MIDYFRTIINFDELPENTRCYVNELRSIGGN